MVKKEKLLITSMWRSDEIPSLKNMGDICYLVKREVKILRNTFSNTTYK